MASERKLWEQTRFDGGIAQSPFYGSANQVADAGDVDAVSVLGTVLLSPNDVGDQTEIPQANFSRGSWVAGSLSDDIGKETVLFSDLTLYGSAVKVNQNSRSPGQVALDVGVSPSEYLVPLFAGYIRVLDRNIVIVKKSGQNGLNIYTPKNGSKEELEKTLKANPENVFKGVGADQESDPLDVASIEISTLEVDGDLLIAWNNKIYRISSISSGFSVETAVTLPSNQTILKMTTYGSLVRIYTIVDRGSSAPFLRHTATDSFVFLWDRRVAEYSSVLEIPGLFIDVATVNNLDYIITDRSIGYFAGDTFSVIRKLPLMSGEVPIPGTAVAVESHITFATTKLRPVTIGGRRLDAGVGFSMWTFGSQQSSNPSVLYKYRNVSLPDEVVFSRGRLQILNDVDVVRLRRRSFLTYNLPTQSKSARESNSVRYFLVGDKTDGEDSVGATYYDIIVPVYPEAAGRRVESGFIETLVVGNETNSLKLLENVSINASIPEKCSVEVDIRVDGKDFGGAVTFLPSGDLAQTKVHDGIVEFTFLQFRVTLRGNGSTTPRLYSIACQFSSREII